MQSLAPSPLVTPPAFMLIRCFTSLRHLQRFVLCRQSSWALHFVVLPGVVALSNYHVALAVCSRLHATHSRGRQEWGLRHRRSKFSYLRPKGSAGSGSWLPMMSATCSVALLNKATNCVRWLCCMLHVVASCIMMCAAWGMLSVNNSRLRLATASSFHASAKWNENYAKWQENRNQHQMQMLLLLQTRQSLIRHVTDSSNEDE